jgi:hypothetical protein
MGSRNAESRSRRSRLLGAFRVYSQGRYWIPLAFPALILLANTKAGLNPRVFARIAVTVILIATGEAIEAIKSTYYK